MVLDRGDRDPERAGDQLVAEALRHQPGYVVLAGRQTDQRLARPRPVRQSNDDERLAELWRGLKVDGQAGGAAQLSRQGQQLTARHAAPRLGLEPVHDGAQLAQSLRPEGRLRGSDHRNRMVPLAIEGGVNGDEYPGRTARGGILQGHAGRPRWPRGNGRTIH